jgi:hypothetical protein
MYFILGFFSMMNYKLSLKEIVLLPSIMGRVPKSHSIHVQNPAKSLFSNKGLVWRYGIRHEGQNKVTF